MTLRVAPLLLVACAAGSALAAGKASIRIVNRSDWSIEELYLSPRRVDRWGPDQLEQRAIESGGSFTLTDIDCDRYDVRLVDEDGRECVIEEVDLCGGSETWEITNEELAGCQAASQ